MIFYNASHLQEVLKTEHRVERRQNVSPCLSHFF